jgi:transcriptional regulator with XRE-family HTH domain
MYENNSSEEQKRNFEIFMKNHQLTAYSWGKLANVTEGTIRSYLKGRSKSLNYQTLVKLAEAVHVLPEDIVNPSEKYKSTYDNKIFIEKNLFCEVMNQIDDLIIKKNLSLSNQERQKLYFSLYDVKSKIPGNYDIENELLNIKSHK